MSFVTMTNSKKGHPLGLHRILDTKKVLPQAAARLDPELPACSNEVLVDVETLQIDSASFAELRSRTGTADGIKAEILEIVGQRGKMQNPVTGSGGMLLGVVREVGADYPDQSLKAGDKIATLISLTSTPLKLAEIKSVDLARERVLVSGHAILFEQSLYAKIPADLPEGAALAAFDICGAPLLAVKNTKAGDSIFILGLGKAGRSILAALTEEFGSDVTIYGTDASVAAVDYCRENFPGTYKVLDAKDPIMVSSWIEGATQGSLANFTINTANVDNTEMAAILSTRNGGKCLFFGMATSFQKAALGAEAVKKDVELLIGSGYTAGHADYMINLVRKNAILRKYFESTFG